jgi:hypothetical protein
LSLLQRGSVIYIHTCHGGKCGLTLEALLVVGCTGLHCCGVLIVALRSWHIVSPQLWCFFVYGLGTTLERCKDALLQNCCWQPFGIT